MCGLMFRLYCKSWIWILKPSPVKTVHPKPYKNYFFSLIKTQPMRFKIMKIELKDEDTVQLWMKRLKKDATVLPDPESILSDPMKIIELGKQVGTAYVKALEETQYDSFITIDYESYNLMDLKVGDVVEVEIRQVDRVD